MAAHVRCLGNYTLINKCIRREFARGPGQNVTREVLWRHNRCFTIYWTLLNTCIIQHWGLWLLWEGLFWAGAPGQSAPSRQARIRLLNLYKTTAYSYRSEVFRTLSWKYLHIHTHSFLALSDISTSSRNLLATISKASSGHAYRDKTRGNTEIIYEI
jgi:hypothetical protein